MKTFLVVQKLLILIISALHFEPKVRSNSNIIYRTIEHKKVPPKKLCSDAQPL